jgi:inner membrane protein
MIFLTHLLGGILIFIYTGKFFGSAGIIATAVAGFFSILPDIDTVKSKLGKRVEPFSTVISLVFRHRGFFHSLAFVCIVYFGMRYIFSKEIAAAAASGYFSHLLLDAITPEGIRPFWPLKLRVKGAIPTNSIIEFLLLLIIVLLLVLKVFW